MDAKQTLINFVKIIDPKLKEYWQKELRKNFGFNQKQKELVIKMVTHSWDHNLRPSKRIRGSFVYYGYKLGKEPDSRIWDAAMGVELVHTGILMHDDLMDLDDVRRGGPTTHKFFENGDSHYGTSMGVCVGDAIWQIGQELLLSSDFDDKLVKDATLKMLRGTANTAWGQAYDLTLEKMPDLWTEDDVITVHKAKTAIYTYENPLFIGAILAGLKGEVFDILHDYSMDGGVAFQLQDDILGVFGDSEKTGKSADSDLLQGKCTLLVLKVLQNGTVAQITDLKKVWGKRSAPKSDIDLAKTAIIDSGSLDYSKKISKDYAAKAVKTAERLRKLKLNPEAIDFIQGVADYMVNRDL